MEYNTEIDILEVSDNWKKTFKTISVYYVDGVFGKYSEAYKALDKAEKRKVNSSVYGLYLLWFILGTFLAGPIFGFLYYLIKGMWLKAIVYTFIAFALVAFIVITNLNLTIGAVYIVIMYLIMPFDYYRYKVLGKQW